MMKSRLSNLMIMLGMDNSCSKILLSLIGERDFVDVKYLTLKTGYSRSMVSYILAKLHENGIVIRSREGHRYTYRINDHFLINIYESFMRRLESELIYISERKSEIYAELYDQINLLKNNIRNMKGEMKWQKL